MCACRERKGFSFMTSKLSRMVGNAKHKRKAFAAQHTFLHDLFTAPRSSLFPFSSHTPPSKPSKRPHFTSPTPSTLPPSPSPLQPTTYSAPCTANSSPIRIRDTPCSAPFLPQKILHIDPHPEKKDLHTHPSPPLHSNPSPLPASEAPCRCRGEHSVHRIHDAPPFLPKQILHIDPHPEKKDLHTHLRLHSNSSPLSASVAPCRYHTLWGVILLALLCTFLCIGKEIAFVVAMAAHLILQLALGLGLLGREPNVNYAAQASFHPHHEGVDNSKEKDNIIGWNGYTWPLNRSSTVPRSRGPILATSLQSNRRSKSWTKIHSSVEGEMQQSKASDCVDLNCSEGATISLPRRGNFSAQLKLQVMVLFTLGGLFHGRFLAMCMALCCILIYSKMERLFFKRRI